MICVVLLTYNRGEKCIKVIQNMVDQNIDNWNLLIIDDGSEKSHTDKIINHIIGLDDHRVEYYRNKNNMGFTNTLNVGMEIFLSDNKYTHFTWISDDNFYSPNYVRNLYNLNVDFSHSAWNNGNHIVNSNYQSYHQLRNNFRGLASFMWSRLAVEKLGFYNPKYKYTSDLEYLYRTYLSIDNIGYSNKSEMNYIIHKDAESVKFSNIMRQEHNELNKIYI